MSLKHIKSFLPAESDKKHQTVNSDYEKKFKASFFKPLEAMKLQPRLSYIN